MNTFPSNNELNSQMTKSSSYLKWKDIPLSIWHKIDSQRYIDTKIGSALILTLSDRDGKSFDVFSTSLVKKELENYQGTIYIRSTGKPEGKKYYGFDIVQINSDQTSHEQAEEIIKAVDDEIEKNK